MFCELAVWAAYSAPQTTLAGFEEGIGNRNGKGTEDEEEET